MNTVLGHAELRVSSEKLRGFGLVRFGQGFMTHDMCSAHPSVENL